jgi:hypothetical protein
LTAAYSPNPAPSLFPESELEAASRIAGELDAYILALITGRDGGPMGLALDDNQKAVLQILRYKRGMGNAIGLAEIVQRLSLNGRTVKGIIRELRMSWQLPIGSSKHGTEGGYYLMITDADRAVWTKDVLDQVRAELAVLRAAAGRQAGLELLGQLHMEAMRDQEAAHV